MTGEMAGKMGGGMAGYLRTRWEWQKERKETRGVAGVLFKIYIIKNIRFSQDLFSFTKSLICNCTALRLSKERSCLIPTILLVNTSFL
jgi:hypothetical protein